MRYSILAVAFLGVLAGCASVPNGSGFSVISAPSRYGEETANPTGNYNYNSTVSSLCVVFKF